MIGNRLWERKVSKMDDGSRKPGRRRKRRRSLPRQLQLRFHHFSSCDVSLSTLMPLLILIVTASARDPIYNQYRNPLQFDIDGEFVKTTNRNVCYKCEEARYINLLLMSSSAGLGTRNLSSRLRSSIMYLLGYGLCSQKEQPVNLEAPYEGCLFQLPKKIERGAMGIVTRHISCYISWQGIGFT